MERDILNDLPNFESGFAEINGVRLYYECAGSGEAVVFVHAGIADRRMWDAQFPVFAQDYQVIRYDMRGFGLSSTSPEPFSHSDDHIALLQYLGVERAHHVGCSKGGTMIIDVALKQPALVRSLIPVCSTPHGYEGSDEEPAQWNELAAAFQANDLSRTAELEVQIWVDGPTRTPEQVDPAVRERVREMDLVALMNEKAGQANPTWVEPPAVNRLGEITAPALVIYGDLDQSGSVSAAPFMAATLPNARLVVIEGTAHVPMMEKPEAFNRVVGEFLRTVGEGNR